jgi:hypothetical protein
MFESGRYLSIKSNYIENDKPAAHLAEGIPYSTC